MLKKISIIIPALNEFNSLKGCLLPLQVWRSTCEIIVVDGGSDDKTASQSIGLVDYFISSPPGRALQMNTGAAKATGDILIFLHADTTLPNAAVHAVLQAIDEGAAWGRFDIELLGNRGMLKLIACCMNIRSRVTGIATGDQVMFMRRDAFVQVGGFPEIALMEDIAISKALKTLSAPYCIKHKVRSSGRRWEKFGVWRTIFLMWSLRVRYFFGVAPETLNRLYRQGKIR